MDDKKQVFEDDGCLYMTPDEIRATMSAAVPTDFDPATVKNTVTDVRYGSLDCQLLDVYYPDDKPAGAPYPVIFFVHGGGWMMGNRRSSSLLGCLDAIKHGYAVVAVEYRLYPQVKYPEFIYDCKAAVRWARANAREFLFDPDRFAMIGDSAGGYNTLMMGFTAGRPELEGEQYGWPGYSSAVQVICDQYGPSDLAADELAWYRASRIKRLSRTDTSLPGIYDNIWGGADNPGLRPLCSPISYVSKSIPPVLIMQGDIDGVVAPEHSTLLKERIDRVCGPERCKLMMFPGKNHADPIFYSPANAELVVSFFDKYLK